MSLLDQIKQELTNLTPEQIREELAKAKAQEVQRAARQKEYNASPEAKEKRKAYSQMYHEKIKSDPEKLAQVEERRKAYNARPDVKEKRKAYQQARNQKFKLLLERAKELGINPDDVAPAPLAGSPTADEVNETANA